MHKQVTATQFPTLDNALVVETCWYMVDSFLTAPFSCVVATSTKLEVTNQSRPDNVQLRLVENDVYNKTC